MSREPVLKFEEFDYEAIQEFELDSSLGYARTYYEQTLDRTALRIIINTIHSRREKGSKLVLLAATVIRENVRPPHKPTAEEHEEFELHYRGWKGAVMKAMSIRRVWQQKRDAQKRKLGLPVPKRPKQTKYPKEADPKKQGQLRFIS